MNVSSFSLLVLLLSYVNLFKELFLFASRILLNLVLLEVSFVLESGCKGIAFLKTSKTFAGKSWIFSLILTDVYN